MILLDMSHIAIARILSDYKNFSSGIDENLFKHMILGAISEYNVKFRNTYGEIVICCDAKSKSWRKQTFPQYKANRKKDESFIDWPGVYKVLDSVIEDLKQFFPYKVINVDRAEGDDCIAVLAKYSQDNNIDTVVVSNDKDFNQLLKYDKVKIYSTKSKSFITKVDPINDLLEHIIKGDSSDGIPNILSPDDSFTNKIRQTPVKRTKMTEDWIPQMIKTYDTGPLVFPAEWDKVTKDRFTRNMNLIDFDCIPSDVSSVIRDQYMNNAPKGDRASIMRYFMNNRMKNLLRDISNF